MRVVHKKHKHLRQTVCGIQFDTLLRVDFEGFFARVRSHKRLITCKRCLNNMEGAN